MTLYRLQTLITGWVLCLLPVCGLAQPVCSGVVTAADGETLAFVSVIADANVRAVTFTDVEGRFFIQFEGELKSLTFRYVGFEEKILLKDEVGQIPAQDLKIILQPSDNALNTVDIIAGENPADVIMRKVIENRRINNPEWEGGYQCKTYNKIIFEPLLNRKTYFSKPRPPESMAGFDKMEADMRERHLFLMETLTERSFRAPGQLQERVLLNRVSGFKSAELIALANAIQPFSFYGDYLPVLDKKFVNPVSPGSIQRYFFSMKDTLYDGSDTIWVIAFKPRKGKVFTGLKGVLHIHSHLFAVQHVLAKPAFGTENLDLTIEQAYHFVSDAAIPNNGKWFPEQLNFEIMANRYPNPGMGIGIRGLSYISETNLEKTLKASAFNPEQPVYMEKNASTRDSALWAPWRLQTPLSSKELKTYQYVDSLGNVKNFDRMSTALGVLSTGIWPLKPWVGLRVNSLIQLNNYENTRIGVGFTNAAARPLVKSRKLEWGASAGYGIADQKFKENAYLLWRIYRGLQTQLRIDFQNDLLEPGAAYEFTSTNFFDRTLYAKRMDFVREFSMQFSTRLSRSFWTSLTVRHQNLSPVGYDYGFQRSENAPVDKHFVFDEGTLFLRFAYGEQVRNFLGNQSTVQRLPAVELAWTSGRGDTRYNRYLAAIYQSVFVRKLGYMRWRLEGGIADPDVPLAKLFTLNQGGGSFSFFAVNETFQSLPDTLFLHNRHLNFFLSQEIGPVFYQRKRSAPFLTIMQNAGWGDLAQPGLHRELGFLSMEKPYTETGVRLDNLLRFNYVNIGWLGIGAAVFYRWGYLKDVHELKNFTPRVNVKFGF